MIASLITSQTRIKLLKKFFLNSNMRGHLRGLHCEFGESTNAIRVELNRLEKAGLLNSFKNGNKKVYRANCDHPLFGDIHNIVLKESGIDRVVERIVSRLGSLKSVFLTGDFAMGKDSKVIELVLVGEDIDENYLVAKVMQAESIVKRKVSYTIINQLEADDYLNNICKKELLLLWNSPGTYKAQYLIVKKMI